MPSRLFENRNPAAGLGLSLVSSSTRLALILGALTMCRPLAAQGLSLDPLIVETQVTRGASLAFSFRVKNLGKQDKARVAASLRELGQNEEGWFTGLSNAVPPHPRSCVNWLRLDKNALVIPPGGESYIRVSATVPKSATGFRYAALELVSEVLRVQGQKVKLRFIVPILLQGPGESPNTKVSVVSAQIEQARDAAGKGPQVLVGALVSNDGNRLARFGGQIGIQRELGGKWQAASVVRATTRRVLPGARLFVHGALPGKLAPGRYRIQVLFETDGKPLPPFEAVLQWRPSAKQ